MQKAGDVLKTLFSHLKVDIEKSAAPVFSSWPFIAGEEFSLHSWVKEVERGLLIVEADHPGWVQLLQMRKGEILRKVKERYPALQISDMRVSLGKRKTEARDSVRMVPSADTGEVTGRREEGGRSSLSGSDLAASLERLGSVLAQSQGEDRRGETG